MGNPEFRSSMRDCGGQSAWDSKSRSIPYGLIFLGSMQLCLNSTMTPTPWGCEEHGMVKSKPLLRAGVRGGDSAPACC